ncbi:efflux RND transporter periplasmic adaptor subunit [Novosphingobium sp. G106]|uniref:efflux RND transporter periplasmic adaptor subunit n=1 Tax=Novosphingobium sp. G106 TaxID=2849500 RepID=UPI001C2DBB3F|nr:efflux RND transporter periplasmic adaptor subunit [Novosphingobium sp. G106]MBV1692400.1 efflux RND transporter periplasmic adaptor subunit [Novosphingobium sp. G106]
MSTPILRTLLPLALAATLAACGGAKPNEEKPETEVKEGSGEKAEAAIKLSPQQIASAGIQLVRPTVGGGGAIELPATIEGDPQGTQVVSAAIGGRVVALTRNLGQSVGRGETLAVIESREAAQLNAEVEAAQARAALAGSNLQREQRLFDERVSAKQDLIAARTAAREADIALRLARQQLGAAGGGGGSLNRLAIRAPIGGQVVARSATLGQTVAADAELFRVANLSTVSLTLSISAADAGRVRPGAAVEVSAPAREGTARVTFVSPVLDQTTRLVPIIATIDNRSGQWRVGESVQAAIMLGGGAGTGISVPSTAVQTIKNKPVVFVRTATGFKVAAVALGQASGGQVTILSGLTGREQIAAANSFILKSELGKGAGGDED